MFDLKRPCRNCPFRKGHGSQFRLGRERVMEIAKATAFQCHKTVDYDHWADEAKRAGDRPQQCAGLMAVLYRDGRDNQITQIAERLLGYDPSQLDPRGEAYETLDDALTAHVLGVEP